MNRVAIILNEHGELQSVASDRQVQCFIVCPHCPRDRVYEYRVDVGVQHVQAAIGGYPIGHAHDGMETALEYAPLEADLEIVR